MSEVSITANPTSPTDQQALPADPEASLRTELLNQLAAAQSELAASLAELGNANDGSALVEGQAQLSNLQALQLSVSTAGPSTLARLQTQVAASVAASAATIQQARATTGATQGSESAQLVAASAATRNEVHSLSADLFDRHLFDSSLHFSSAEDKAEYQRRDTDMRRYIEDQLARGTPEGDLNAAGGVMDRMLDAQAHGAGANPEFLPRWNRLVETTRKQHELMRAEGRSTEEFDRHVQDSVRRYLKSQGLSDHEIAARLAASADPLDAVKPYLRSEREAQALDQSVIRAGKESLGRDTASMQVVAVSADTPAVTSEPAFASLASVPTGLDDVMAKLQASGVVAANAPPEQDVTHGVGVTTRGPRTGARGGSTPS